MKKAKLAQHLSLKALGPLPVSVKHLGSTTRLIFETLQNLHKALADGHLAPVTGLCRFDRAQSAIKALGHRNNFILEIDVFPF